MSENSIEVFRLRREHKKQKDLSRKHNVDKKPLLRMQLQEQSSMNMGIANGQDFVEVVSGIDAERAQKGSLEDEVRDLQKKTNFS